MSNNFKNSKDLLTYLNDKAGELHTKYENLFWISYMGDHSVDDAMNKARTARDEFRASADLKKEVESSIKTAKGEDKMRLAQWLNFFSLYQTPEHAMPIRTQVAEIEARIEKKRATRKEGYIDPKTGTFVEASENKMRSLMRTHPDEDVRKACFDSMEKLPYDTIDDFVELIKLRNKFAKTLGYSDFYEYKLKIDEDMTKKELFSIFEKIYQRTKYAFKDIRALEKQHPGLRKPWNYAYMLTGNFTKEEDPYFQFEDVVSLWGRSFAALGIGFRGGTVTLDLLDRKGKYNNGFCHYPVVVQYKNGKLMPGSSNFTSNAIPGQLGSGAQGLHTVFHEGGHAADRLNSLQKDVCVNTEYPPNSVSWAETHSMFMDSISASVEWRIRYAKNSAGEEYPFELFERKARKLAPITPLAMMPISAMVFFEKALYEKKDITTEFVIETAKKINKKFFDRSTDSVWPLNVPHIYSWESSAYYHGYGLAELTVCQWRSYFFKKYGYIVDNKKVGKEMKAAWSYASSMPAKKLVKLATGKKLGPEDFINDVTTPIEKRITLAHKKVERLAKVPKFTGKVDLNGHINLVHGTQKIADNSKSFEDMEKTYREWIATQHTKPTN